MKIKYFCADGGVHPILGQVLYRQARAENGPETAKYQRYLCGVLNAVAQTTEDCDRLLSFIDRVEIGEERIETGGNDVALTFEKRRVQVDILVNEDWIGQEAGNFDVSEWKTALEGWRRFLQMPKARESIVEISV